MTFDPYAPPRPMDWHRPPAPFAAYVVGEDLVVSKEAVLPNVCVKCGSADIHVRKMQSFAYVPPWIFFAACAPVLYLILYFMLNKTGRLELPFCRACDARLRQARLVALAVAIPWLVVLFGVPGYLGSTSGEDVAILAFFGLAIAGAIPF